MANDDLKSNLAFGNRHSALPAPAAEPLQRTWTEAEAFAYCSQLTRSHYENFPVGSSLIPKELRPAIHSLYAFMRTADDFSDENRRAGDEAERMAWLESWEQMLTECVEGKAKHPILIALRVTLERHQLPVQWLRDLLHAFKMDVTVRRYATAEELFTYCRYSANPVGRLVLTLFGYRDEALYRLSDHVCTGLQLANHWQDVAVDLKKDRIYLPQEDMNKFGVTVTSLLNLASPRLRGSLPTGEGETFSRREKAPDATTTLASARGVVAEGPDEAKNFRQLLAFEVIRTRELFAQGRHLPEKVTGRLKWELRFTWQGGVRILDKIEQAHYDVLHQRPVVTKADWLGIAARTLF